MRNEELHNCNLSTEVTSECLKNRTPDDLPLAAAIPLLVHASKRRLSRLGILSTDMLITAVYLNDDPHW
jgi:hypothetical protein